MKPATVPNTESQDLSEPLIEAVREAHARRTPLAIHGGNTKVFYGHTVEGEPLDVGPHAGVVNYEPTELVITARAGTRLDELASLLAEHDQMLAFEPPRFGEHATLGGCVAAGLSGPRRPYGWSVRDSLLGVEIISGEGKRLKFGGEVMKNVAGYDLSRLMAGALGTLGVLLQISLRLLPAPARESTRVLELDPASALERMNTWARRPLPVSATWYDGQDLYVRLSGGDDCVKTATEMIGGDEVEHSDLWLAVREQTAAFFRNEGPLWRLSLPPATPMLNISGACAVEWSGALRWMHTDTPADLVRRTISSSGGHATLFRGGDRRVGIFQPLPPSLLAVHKRLKRALDPAGILNPGRVYAEL